MLLTGEIMGGGPSTWGVEEILRSGGKVFATPDAARTLNDDLEQVASMGITIISSDEAEKLPDQVLRVKFLDFDFETIRQTFGLFGMDLLDLDAIAVAVFDHGAAPSNVSDRKFRFDYLDERIKLKNRLSAFAYPSDAIPAAMTRLQAVANSARDLTIPLVVMDTAPAAVLGALYDPQVRLMNQKIVANIGNFHTLAFRLGKGGIEGVFEHHTGLVDRLKLETYLNQMADGSLDNKVVFNDHGHGALLYSDNYFDLLKHRSLVVTGPRRSVMEGSLMKPCFPAPFGDMMIAGCFGLLSAVGDVIPQWKEEIESRMNSNLDAGLAPWDLV